MHRLHVKAVFAFSFLVLAAQSRMEARQDIRELLNKKLDYDAVIRQSGDALSHGTGDAKELKAFQAYAYLLKGKLLLTAYASGADLEGLYFSCKESGISKGENFSFVQGMNSAAQGKTADASNQFKAFQKASKDKRMLDLASVWIGCVADKSGKSGERDNAWKGIDWKNYANASERQAAYAVLGMKTGSPVARPAEISDPVLVRNTLISSAGLLQLSSAEKIAFLRKLQLDKPMFSVNGKGGKKEVYFDVAALLAAGKANLSIAKDLFGELDKSLTAEERSGKKFSAIRNLTGQAAYFSEDYDGTIRALENDNTGTSPVYLGAAYFQSGNSAKAEQSWKVVEQSADVRLHSELGFVYALLGITLDRAEELTSQFLASSEDTQTPDERLFYHYAVVKQRQGDFARAKEIFNQGYNFMRRGVLEAGANDPEYTIAFCAAIQRVDRTGMYDINDMLYKVREKYDFGVQLHEAATGLATCLEIKLGK